jgi:7-cyano-7-deazaguanine synthase
MCSVYGALVNRQTASVFERIGHTFSEARERGRDGWGIVALTHCGLTEFGRSKHGAGVPHLNYLDRPWEPFAILGSRRAEPTTEWKRRKREADVQPFFSPGGWVYCHSGTIANDRELLSELRSHLSFHQPETTIDSGVIGVALDCLGWRRGIRALEGSFAIVAAHEQNPSKLMFACNYKPLFLKASENRALIEITSQPDFFAKTESPLLEPQAIEVPPYSIGCVTSKGELNYESLYPPRTGKRRVLAVASGGLDSTVAAWKHHVEGDEVTLLHVDYRCRAGLREIEAVRRISERMSRPAVTIETDFFARAARSVLTDGETKIQRDRGGERGAEFGYEWVPARNTVLLSLALAYAEAHDFDTLTLGTNLEESGGGYPDNEQEFVNKIQQLTPYALKPYHRVEISQPCGTLMKHEIVKLGHELHAPIELTWSCYEGGREHCGSCGPCWMRQVGHLMNRLVDPVFAERWPEIERKHGVDETTWAEFESHSASAVPARAAGF